MIKDVMERDMINEISTLFVMIFTSIISSNYLPVFGKYITDGWNP